MSQPTLEQAKSMFDRIDADKDGRVTWDEVGAFSETFAAAGFVVKMGMESKGVKKDEAVTFEEFKAFFGL
ncbi:hypothetical protein [Kitasatospora sp. NPDC091207]|uniref:hypothetical protein n=1 Tax=Kitasatospora sp. NPDC091207 TaxID=3364083 RepID=UPI00381CDB17